MELVALPKAQKLEVSKARWKGPGAAPEVPGARLPEVPGAAPEVPGGTVTGGARGSTGGARGAVAPEVPGGR